jgi:O-acetyl-ADP-ribose deacetylase (regulator of RNase III)
MSVTNVTPLVGDLFQSRAQTLVNTVNCVGIMGKGIALEFKARFPEMFRDYVRRCQRHEVRLGEPYLWTPIIPPWVLNFPTKDHWRAQTRVEDVEAGLRFLKSYYKEWGIRSLAVPPLGTGNGGLEWRIVGPTLYRHLSELDIPVELFAPYGTPPEELEPAFLGQGSVGTPADLKVSPAAIAIAEIVRRLQKHPYRSPVGRVAFQKIAYFATETGIPTNLVYSQGAFGPFSEDLGGLKRRLINNGVLVERQVGPAFVAEPGPTYLDAVRVYEPYLENWEQLIEQVVDLFMRLRTTRQAEVAATVHYATKVLNAQRGNPPTEFEVLSYVRQWKERRQPPLTDDELGLAIRSLNALGWLRVTPSSGLPVLS